MAICVLNKKRKSLKLVLSSGWGSWIRTASKHSLLRICYSQMLAYCSVFPFPTKSNVFAGALCVGSFFCLKKIKRDCLIYAFKFGWGSWIRTNACWIQRPVPYRLAIPQCGRFALYNRLLNKFTQISFMGNRPRVTFCFL